MFIIQRYINSNPNDLNGDNDTSNSAATQFPFKNFEEKGSGMSSVSGVGPS